MKKTLLLIITLTAFTNVFAQMNAVIYSEAGEKFTLYLNGEPMNSTPQANVKLQNLTSEFYQARVDFQDATLADLTTHHSGVGDSTKTAFETTLHISGIEGEWN